MRHMWLLAQDMVHTQQLFFWQHFRANRLKGNPPAAAAAQHETETEAQSGGFNGGKLLT